ncbi:ArsJ-associated glyceraldehyde-3-phosphate dehydrogenase [Pseudemcibacter aquimaris]|uniref:ArsJ-associated glyceraldehyde-3-phosphate dehydrogenase n=1 Tax=Pseudemcibacter aquimaris TaxID=2857064 RepID=UPI002010F870|nr:ArsJ-associated glyceraldehyde-3-phosphate dehydrogenase [Pseudemcibacter aquimaris]MCC3862497.1 ArsJ-associated glyceraldehyde-3-phosphate dehydrogenase [Pseudemcibacter aquimaris]WDU57759.1 ArsJ-associated glyceraldehyde-3-phosphate dehydrogenase [Pseudemcibacter aquimaris]
MTKIAINGFGRMGKLYLRALLDRTDIDVVAINEPFGGIEAAAHLLEFDTVHGRWDGDININGNVLTVNGQEIVFTEHMSPSEISWTGDDVDIVIECSGKFKSRETLQPYYDRNIQKVLVSAPVKEEGALNLVMGVNDDLYDAEKHDLITAASCTTNCLAPVVKVIHEKLGIKHGSMTTIHDVTNTQVIVDMPHKDLRRSRSCLNSLIPTTTGSATAITIIYPELKGKLNGHAVRVPLLNTSLTDCVFELETETDAKTVNSLFREAENTYLKDILGIEDRPLVSTDFVNDPRSSIVDGPSTMVVNGTQLKLYVWYDNEWGYVNRMVELTEMIANG